MQLPLRVPTPAEISGETPPVGSDATLSAPDAPTPQKTADSRPPAATGTQLHGMTVPQPGEIEAHADRGPNMDLMAAIWLAAEPPCLCGAETVLTPSYEDDPDAAQYRRLVCDSSGTVIRPEIPDGYPRKLYRKEITWDNIGGYDPGGGWDGEEAWRDRVGRVLAHHRQVYIDSVYEYCAKQADAYPPVSAETETEIRRWENDAQAA